LDSHTVTDVVSVYAGSPADSADTLEVGDEILEVNGRTLENATHNEVIQYIHQVIALNVRLSECAAGRVIGVSGVFGLSVRSTAPASAEDARQRDRSTGRTIETKDARRVMRALHVLLLLLYLITTK